MSESNITHTDQTHRIYISSPKPVADRTNLYIILLLFLLLFLLIFYLVYNLISFKRYSSSQKNNKKKNAYLYLEKELNDRLSIILTQINEDNMKRHSHSYEKLIIPLQITSSLSMHQNTNELISNL